MSKYKKLTFITLVALFSIFNVNTISASNIQTDSMFFEEPKVVEGKSDNDRDNSKYESTSELTDVGKLANQALGTDIGNWDSFMMKNGGWDMDKDTLTTQLNKANDLRNQINSAKTQADKNELIAKFERQFGIPYDPNNSSIGSIDYYITEDGRRVKKLSPSVKNFRYLDKIVFTFQRLDGTTNVKVNTAKTVQYLQQKNSSVLSKYGRTPTITQSGNTITIDFDGNLVGMHDFIRDTWTGTHNNFNPVMYATFPNKQGMYKVTAKVYAGQYKELSDYYGFSSRVYGLDEPCNYCDPTPKTDRILTKNLTLRKKADEKSDSIGVIKKGSIVTYVGKGNNGYTKVKYGKYTGYVLTSGIKVKQPDICYYSKSNNKINANSDLGSFALTNAGYGNNNYDKFYQKHPTSNYKIPFYTTAGWNGVQIKGKTTKKMGGFEYQLEYWPYKEGWVKKHDKAAERRNLITSTNGYAELISKKTNKVPDGIQDGILVATYEWKIGVMEKDTPIPGDDGKNAEIGSTLTK